MEFQDNMMKVGFAPNSLTFKYVIDGISKCVRSEENASLTGKC